ncbi:MAG TPA: acetyl-CoA C-acyltransferase [Candidatus Xenobia bacterium]|jgi:acetyl-CoA acyltransferase
MPKAAPAPRRVAIVDGVRTPFARAMTHYAEMTALDLAVAATRELVERLNLPTPVVEEVIMGTVIASTSTPNLAREVVLASGLPRDIPGFTLNRACASGVQAMICGAQGIQSGAYECVLAGGGESLSSVPVPYSRTLIHSLLQMRKARDIKGRVAALKPLSMKDLLPRPPDLTEWSTGLTMGQHAEAMARKNNISRIEQDRYAFESHLKAARAQAEGRFKDQLAVTFPPPRMKPVTEDNTVRTDADISAMSTLPPVFDKRYGTITAANASGLTDGASVVLLMSEEKAKSLGYTPLGFIKAYANAALDPNDQLLLGPAYATPKALDKAGLSLSDMSVVEMHEAFAAQVLSCTQAMASEQFCKDKLGRSKAVGEIEPDRFNPSGGSIALGHPFGATGGRLVISALRELARVKGQFALVTLCAAGGMGTSMILERN